MQANIESEDKREPSSQSGAHTLNSTFSNEKLFEAYMNHLTKEFSLECCLRFFVVVFVCLCKKNYIHIYTDKSVHESIRRENKYLCVYGEASLIEWAQFKDLLQKTYPKELGQESIRYGGNLLKLTNIPKSSIVYGKGDGTETLEIKDFKQKAYLLSDIRRELIAFMQDSKTFLSDDYPITVHRLFTMFDKCTKEVYHLQQDDSFSRFARSEVSLLTFFTLFLKSDFSVVITGTFNSGTHTFVLILTFHFYVEAFGVKIGIKRNLAMFCYAKYLVFYQQKYILLDSFKE
ncbi:hypothetical protein RFI_04794 [Reticulomyxa filosa]|uniref:RGS domain-containing protein n=1 Tax=Reticulomyxa filosa TaxID=46433 RepID=X6P2F6_RETFI|nr:hypothetical protein RFI_04794 [Reticulomyxa filosa]|eukprot:ETO32323.1 hypothetical protein RFI_04794 [Reticulomyxa filosa]